MADKEKPPHIRLALRLLHVYFSFARGMTMGVRAACFDAEGRIFLVRHSYIGGWHMPGGGLEPGKTYTLVAREAGLSWNPKDTQPLDLLSYAAAE